MASTQLRPLRVGEILDAAIKIYRRNAGLLIKLAVPVIIPAALITFVIQSSALPDGAQIVDDSIVMAESDLTTYNTAVLIGTLVTYIAILLATGALYRAVAQTYIGSTPEWKASLRYASRRFPRLLWLTVLYTVLLIVGLIGFAIPTIWMFVAFSCATPVLMSEGIGGWKALTRSTRLVKDNWWRSAGVLLVGNILALIVATMLVGLALAFVNIQNPDVYLLVDTFATAVIVVLTTPFTVAATTVLYFDLRVRKEAFDLELLAREAGVDAIDLSRLPIAPPSYPQWNVPLGGAGTAPSGDQPPYWPPPPGWTPQSAQTNSSHTSPVGDGQLASPRSSDAAPISEPAGNERQEPDTTQ